MREQTSEESLWFQPVRQKEVVRRGHFVFANVPEGSIYQAHSEHYVNKALISAWPDMLMRLCAVATAEFDTPVDLVVSPATGAILFGGFIGFCLDTPAIFAEKDGKNFVIEREFSKFIAPGTRVLIAEDVITTGGTVRKLIKLVEEMGGAVAGVIVLWLRRDTSFDQIPLHSIIYKEFPEWKAEECPLCKAGEPFNIELGHGKEFLEQFGANPRTWPANRN